MKELLAAVLSEDENGTFSLAFHLDDETQQTPRVDKLLSALVQARVALQPPAKTQMPKPGDQLVPILNSPWQADPLPNGDVLLSLHHPALGPVTWLFAKAGVQDMALGLSAVAGSAIQSPGSIQ